MRMAIPSFVLSAGILTLFATAVSAADPPVPAAGSSEVVRQGPDGFTLRITVPPPTTAPMDLPQGGTYLSVTIPGYGPQGGEEAVGLPNLPRRGFPFALPEGAVPRLTTRVISSTTFHGSAPLPVPHSRFVYGDPFPTEVDSYTPNAAVYRSGSWFPATVAELGPTAGWRHQRVSTVSVSPVQAIPATGEYRVATGIEVTVSFDRRGEAPSAVRRVPAGPDAPGWDEIQDKVLVNGTSAGAFRTQVAPQSVPRAFPDGQVFIRVRIGTSGFCRIPFATLAAEGFPADLPVGNVQVEERGYDANRGNPFTVTQVSRQMEDTNQNGVFDTGDFVMFYAFNYRDRFNPRFADARYSYFHTYWITASDEGGEDIPTIDGYPGGDGWTRIDAFPQDTHYEVDRTYITNPPQDGNSIYPSKSSLYWFDPRQVDETVPIVLHDPNPAGTYQVKALWQGIYSVAPADTHIVSFGINDCMLVEDHHFKNQETFAWDSGTQSISGCLVDGENDVHVLGRAALSTVVSGSYFDWFDLNYSRLTRAHDDRLVFNTWSKTGNLEFRVTGFTVPDVKILEITDPVHPVWVTPHVEADGDGYAATIRVVGTGEQRTFVALIPSQHTGLPVSEHPLPPDLGTKFIARGLTRDILAEGNGSDYVLVTHPEFRDAWAPLVQHREAQGHHVLLCDVWEIYDEFAGGDKTPWAIRRFLTQAYRNWDPAPSYLMLGGDASEDYRKDLTTSDPDWVPTMMHFGLIPGPGGRELAGTDNWYVGALRPGDDELDVLPEMHVGRLTVGSVDEVNDVVQKILAFENAQPTDTWRKRGFFFADDQYSTAITFSAGYCWKSDESKFRLGTEAMCDSIPRMSGMVDFQCVPFYLNAYVDTVASLGRHPGVHGDCPHRDGRSLLTDTIGWVRDHVTPLLVNELSRGELVWEFTGHANRNIITTETTFQNYPRLSVRDVDRVNNLGKPFLFFGYACHLAEFEHANEGSNAGVGGESIGESLLLAPNRGAVATVASTAYELLLTNPDAQSYTTRALFWDLPRDPATGRPRRILGDCMTRAFVANALEHGMSSYWSEMLRTYVTLGDPALVVDIAAADFRVEVDGAQVTDGTPLTAASFQDSLLVTATISDDVDVSTIRVTEDGTEIPPDRLTVVPPGAEDQGVQTYQVRFKTLLRLGTYDIAFEATDWSGRTSRFTLPVQFQSEFTADGKKIGQTGDDLVDSTAVIQVRLTSPVPLAADAITLVVDGGAPVDPVMTKLDAEGRQWTVDLERTWAPGQHSLDLRVTDRVGGELSRSVKFMVSGEAFSLLNSFFYPNPADGGGGRFVYTLNETAQDARVTIYTVSGRRVLRTPVPSLAGTNAFVWDLRDEGGDRVANGVYLLMFDAHGGNGKEIKHLERVAVAR